MEELRSAAATRPLALAAVFREAAAVQACAACCLRLAGVRAADAYTSDDLPASAAGVLEALWMGGHEPAAAAAEEASDDLAACEGSKRRRVAAAPAVCPLCLGLLQVGAAGHSTISGSTAIPVQLITTVSSLNAPTRRTAVWGPAAAAAAAAAQAEAAAAAADGEAGGGDPSLDAPIVEQRTASVSDLAAAAAAINAEFEFTSWGLEASLPASLAVRQQALSWRLRQRGEQADCAGMVDAMAQAIDMKEAVKLRYTAALEAALGKPHDPSADLRIALTVTHPDAAAECGWLAPSGGGGRKQRRGEGRHGRNRATPHPQGAEVPALTESALQRLAAMPQAEIAASCPPSAVQLAAPAAPATLQLQARRRPLYLGGRYLKLRRGIPQSPWCIDGQRKGEGSVQEALEQALLPALQADSYTMVAAGREDIDVRMLGEGRPFILEAHNARRRVPPPAELRRLEAAVAEGSAGGVAARGLFAAEGAQLQALKEGEQEKQKSYVAVCWLPRPLGSADVALLGATRDLEVQQDTPIRVLHRRANLCRPRAVHEMRAGALPGQPPGYFTLHLRTQAGAYIKEFVHSDLGRSRPSLGDLLGCAAQIVSLDVLQIHMEFGGGASSSAGGG